MRSETLVVAPHPDDETIACGGTILDRLKQGRVVRVVLLTDGRNSHSICFGIHQDPDPEQVATLRAAEFQQALALLGVATGNIHCLGFCDAALESSIAPATAALAALLKPCQTRITEVFFPASFDAHPDHQAAHRIVDHALNQLGIYPERLCYAVWPDAEHSQAPADREIDISAHLETKARALSLYVSQVQRITPEQPEAVLPAAMLAAIRKSPVERFWNASVSDESKN
ncbi:MAG: PIG-L deacetylase family protein [Desulfovibrio sp.]